MPTDKVNSKVEALRAELVAERQLVRDVRNTYAALRDVLDFIKKDVGATADASPYVVRNYVSKMVEANGRVTAVVKANDDLALKNEQLARQLDDARKLVPALETEVGLLKASADRVARADGEIRRALGASRRWLTLQEVVEEHLARFANLEAERERLGKELFSARASQERCECLQRNVDAWIRADRAVRAVLVEAVRLDPNVAAVNPAVSTLEFAEGALALVGRQRNQIIDLESPERESATEAEVAALRRTLEHYVKALDEERGATGDLTAKVGALETRLALAKRGHQDA
jgi:hypothetical protein